MLCDASRSMERELRIRGALLTSSVFGCLTSEELDLLTPHCRIKKSVKGEPIWVSGAESSFLGLVLGGFVRMVKSNSNGSEMTVELMGPNQTFGLLGVIAGCGCPLMAYGLTNTSYLQIPKAAFLEVYESSSEMKSALLRKTAIRMHGKIDFMSQLSSGTAEQRLAAVLLSLAESYGTSKEQGLSLDVPLTRQSLAEMTGLTTETTIRVLSKWTQERLIATDHQQITLLRPSDLEQKVA